MTYLKRIPLLLALIASLAAVGCGDDDKKDDDGDDMAGDGDGDGDGDVDAGPGQCVGATYGGFTLDQLLAKDAATGACIGDAQVKVVCETAPGDAARMAGGYCFSMLGKSGDALRTCTIEGEGNIEGVRASSPGLSEDCLNCFAESVACTVEAEGGRCALPCAADPLSEDCVTCREEVGCTPEFYTCSGLPRPEDL